jgi:hypothetical protein
MSDSNLIKSIAFKRGVTIINVASTVIDESEVDRVARLLHEEFFAEVDPEVFALPDSTTA